ncbi:MAG: hypothetical protein JXR91_02880 [Deltaproteobacteria bacterium]|nr:hypothetical protein [Deltaproteobacteria bacterium]
MNKNISMDLFDKKWVKRVLFILMPMAVFFLVSAGITVSKLGIKHTIVVYAQNFIVPDAYSTMRISLIDDANGFFLPSRVKAVVVDDKGKHYKLFDHKVASGADSLSINYKSPSIKCGDAQLLLSIFFDGQNRILRKKIKVLEKAEKESLIQPPDIKYTKFYSSVSVKDVEYQIFTEDRGAPAGLPTLFFLRTLSGEETPVSTSYKIKLPTFSAKISNKLIEGKTDRYGIDLFSVKPLDLHFPVEIINIAASDTDNDTADSAIDSYPVKHEPAYIYPHVVYSGIKADLSSPIIRYNDPVKLRISRISGAGPVYLNFFKEGVWIYSMAVFGDASNTTASVPLKSSGIIRVQVSDSPLGATTNVAVRHFYKSEKDQSLNSSFNYLISKMNAEDHAWKEFVLKNIPEDEREINILSSFALSSYYNGYNSLERLISSRQDEDRELNKFKHKFQTVMMISISLLGLMVIGMILLAAGNALKRQKQITLLIEEDDNLYSTVKPESSKFQFEHGIQLVILFSIVISAFMAIALLVMTISWDVVVP